MTKRELVECYFDAESRGDVDAVVALCAPDVIVRNAAQPSQHGLEGVRGYVTGFRDRTAERAFRVLSVADGSDVVFAAWQARLVFKAGISFGAIVPRRPFSVDLTGICRFRLDREGRVTELDVYHETTSAAQRASANI